MGLVTIYEDDNKKVAMPEKLVKVFNKMINDYFSLSKSDMEKVLDRCFDYISSISPRHREK